MCLDVRGIQCGAVPVDVTSGVGFRLQRLKDALPRAIAPPAYEAVVAGLVGPVPGWDVAPAGAGTKPPEDAVDYLAVITPGLPSRGVAGQVRRQCAPLRFSQVVACHTLAYTASVPSDTPQRRYRAQIVALRRPSASRAL